MAGECDRWKLSMGQPEEDWHIISYARLLPLSCFHFLRLSSGPQSVWILSVRLAGPWKCGWAVWKVTFLIEAHRTWRAQCSRLSWGPTTSPYGPDPTSIISLTPRALFKLLAEPGRKKEIIAFHTCIRTTHCQEARSPVCNSCHQRLP